MAGFTNAAAAGQVEVSPEGGRALLEVIHRFVDEMDSREYGLRRIVRQPPLGHLKGGEVIAPFMVQVATDADGFITRFRELRESLIVAGEAIEQAMKNYQATDEANAASLNQISGSLS